MQFFDGLTQVCYVTNDMDLGIQVMEREFGVTGFRLRELQFPIRVGAEHGTMHIKVAVAVVGGGMKVEMIQALSDVADFYGQKLAPEREAGLGLHHTGVSIAGEDDGPWQAHLAALEARGEIHCTGDLGADIKFVYVDERKTLGHFVEHYWIRPGL